MFFKKKMYRYVYGIKSVLVNGNLKISKMARENALIEICLVAAVKGYDFLTGGRVRKEIELAMDTFIPEEMNRKRLSKVKRDMWKNK